MWECIVTDSITRFFMNTLVQVSCTAYVGDIGDLESYSLSLVGQHTSEDGERDLWPILLTY